MTALRVLSVGHWEAQAVLLPGPAPQLVTGIRLTIFGDYFPIRAVEPEVLVGEIEADHLRIAVDQRSIVAYFSMSLPDGAPVRVRYGDSAEGECRESFFSEQVAPMPHDCL